MAGEEERQFQIIKNVSEVGQKIDMLLKAIEIKGSMRIIAKGHIWSTKAGLTMIGKQNEIKIIEQIDRIAHDKKVELILREVK